MRYNKLVAKHIIDKNGRATTVHVRPDSGSSSRTARIVPTRRHQVALPSSPKAEADRDPNSIFFIKEWSGIPLKHTYVKAPAGNRFVLAPEGYSGAYCDTCGSFFKDDQIRDASVVCDVCRRHSRGGRIITGVRYGDVSLFDDAVARDTDWYHITTRSDWEDDIRSKTREHQPFIHIGSEEAAMRRMDDILRSGSDSTVTDKTTFYRYRVRLTPDAALSPHVLPDFDSAAPRSPYDARKSMRESPDTFGLVYETYEMFGATRYVNEFESHGSVSLIAHPDAIEVLDRIELPPVVTSG